MPALNGVGAIIKISSSIPKTQIHSDNGDSGDSNDMHAGEALRAGAEDR